jgi:hypothetical protein
MCLGMEGSVLEVNGQTVEVLTSSGKRTCMWTAAELPHVGDRVLTFANLGLGVIPEETADEPRDLEEGYSEPASVRPGTAGTITTPSGSSAAR